MCANSLRRATVILSALVGGVGCFRSTAPEGWLPRAEAVPLQAFGAWIRLEDRPRRPTTVYEGELIAIDADTVHILLDRLVSLPRSSFCCITVTAFRVDLAPIVVWGLAGTLSTASHGFGLILSAPIWALTATGAAASATYAPRVRSADADTLRVFARFPQGIPAGLDRTTLRSKPSPTTFVRPLRQ
jgi:hypothetical protein